MIGPIGAVTANITNGGGIGVGSVCVDECGRLLTGVETYLAQRTPEPVARR